MGIIAQLLVADTYITLSWLIRLVAKKANPRDNSHLLFRFIRISQL
jgi:hypothetical protein